MKKLPSKTNPKSTDVGVIYARYSSHSQKDASIEQQVAECLKKANEIGLKIISTYEDRAITGKTDKRPNFQRMMKEAEKGKFQYVIAWKSNRIGRNMLEAMINEARLQDVGVRLIYVEEDFDDSAAGRFALRSMMNVNQFYSENMAEDIKRGLYDNAMQCKVANGHLPLGYKAGENLEYIIDKPKDETVREIYTRVAAREPFVDIYTDLNRRGITTSLGKPWGRSSFKSILKNERYRGVYIYGDIRKENGIPRIVSDELFYKVQEVLKTKRNAQGKHRDFGTYMLTGKLYCGKCGAPMIGFAGTSKQRTLHHYYGCRKRKIEHICDKQHVRRDEIELSVAQAIRDYALTDDVINWIADKTIDYNSKCEKESEIVLLQEQLATSQQASKNILRAIEQGIITDTTKQRLLELENEQADINSKIYAAKADIITVSREDLIAGLSLFKNGNIDDMKYRASLFDTFLVAVYLYDDDMRIVFSVPGGNKTVNFPFDNSILDDINIDDVFARSPLASTRTNLAIRDFFS